MAEQTGKTTASTEQAPPGGHGSFPPFDSQNFPSQLFWLALTFVALYLLMSRIALPQVASILEHRRKHVDDHLAEAQRLKGESEEVIAARESRLAESRTRAQKMADDARAKAAADAESRRKDLDANLAARITEAEKAIAEARSTATTNVHGIAEDAARSIVERLTGISPTDRDVTEAVRDALKR
jgi:F-type H+-transporting ATPase subunit b